MTFPLSGSLLGLVVGLVLMTELPGADSFLKLVYVFLLAFALVVYISFHFNGSLSSYNGSTGGGGGVKIEQNKRGSSSCAARCHSQALLVAAQLTRSISTSVQVKCLCLSGDLQLNRFFKGLRLRLNSD